MLRTGLSQHLFSLMENSPEDMLTLECIANTCYGTGISEAQFCKGKTGVVITWQNKKYEGQQRVRENLSSLNFGSPSNSKILLDVY